jgi:hypothetical protein
MIRTCPKCGAYYADEQLGFCLRDGTPLIGIDPSDRNWTEATRSVDRQQRALRKLQRKVRWRRLVMTGMTTLMVTMVVCVVAVNGLIYLAPKEEGPTDAVAASTAPGDVDGSILLNADSSPTPVGETPTPGFTPSLAASPESSVQPSPSPSVRVEVITTLTVTPTPTPTPTPVVVHRITGRVTAGGRPLGSVKVSLEGTMLTSTTTDGNGYYNFNGLPEGGTYYVTPRGQTNFSPSNQSFSNLRQDASADFSAPAQHETATTNANEPHDEWKPPPVCTEADRQRERDALLNRYSAIWRRSFESEKPKVVAGSSPAGGRPAGRETTATLGEIYFTVIFKECNPVLVRARYEWQVHVPGDAYSPGKESSGKNMTIRRERTCGKLAGMWICH